MRPTIRCLREELRFALPPAHQPLDTVDHLLVAKANAAFATPTSRGERIAALDDRVLLKVKVQRWRGAVWRPLPEQWLCAAGWREEGSADDFYSDLATRCRAWRKEYNRPCAIPIANRALAVPVRDRLLCRLKAPKSTE